MSAIRWSALLICIGVWASGCASTQLNLNLDLYTEDPSPEVALRPISIVKLRSSLSAARTESESLGRDRIELGRAMVATYAKIYGLMVSLRPTSSSAGRTVQPASAPPAPDPAAVEADLRGLRSWLDAYVTAVNGKVNDVHLAIDKASGNVDAYVQATSKAPTGPKTASPPSPVSLPKLDEVLKAVDIVGRALAQLSVPLGTDFERGFADQWPVVMASLTPDNLAKFFVGRSEPPQVLELRLQLAALAQTMAEISARGRQVSRELADRLTAAAAIAGQNPGRLKLSIDAVAQAATTVPLSLGLGDRGMTALNDLVRSTTLFYSQVDRLQDPADPVWRIVGDVRNEAKWNITFSETYFYSEGNNSVFVVRDTPISYRVQRGANNPTALVQGQLQISRAIANAAISVAGAAVGAPIPKLPGTADSGKPESTEGADAEKLARRDATVERQAAVRAQSIRGLRLRMQTLRDQLQRIDPNDTQAAATALAQLRSVLSAYESVFASPPK